MRNVLRIAIIAIACASLIVGYYFYLTRRAVKTAQDEGATEISEMDKVLSRDLVTNYPATPREVMKFYNRIMTLYYAPDTTDAQVELLCDQAMMLFDADLLQQNPRETYVMNVKTDIATFRTRNKKVVNTDVCNTSDVVYKTLGKDEMAYVICYYFISEGSEYQRTYQRYALRKDKEGKWKILAFELTDAEGD